ncbi:MAG: DUF2752 domain-containing protein [Myxococcales bacterium]|nr:DUF2752 domain-containing protein [Myxococcales bacterium]
MQGVDPVAVTTTPSAADGRWKRVGLVALSTLPVIAAVASDFPLCPTAGLFGIPCPGCGLTRATSAVLHGHVLEGLHYHPLVLVVAPVYIATMVSLAVGFVRGGGGKGLSHRANVILTIVALTLFAGLFFVWIARFLGYFGGPVPVVRFSEWQP